MRVNGADVSGPAQAGFVRLEREWSAGDEVLVDCPMEARFLAAHEKVLSCSGRAAVQSGPLVFCAEEHDLGVAPQLFRLDDSARPKEVEGHGEWNEVALQVEGSVDIVAGDQLYGGAERVGSKACRARLVPYFTWANRGPNSMLVWLRR